MARIGGYIPRQDDDFFTFQANLVNEVVANAVAWSIPAPSVAILTGHRSVYEPLYTIVQNKKTRTGEDVLLHRQERDLYEKDIRTFAKAYLMFSPLVTDGDRTRMNLTIPDTEPTPKPKITTTPVVEFKNSVGGDIEVRCRVTSDQTRPSMHPDAGAIELRFIMVQIGEVPPDTAIQCPEAKTSTTARFTIYAGQGNVGKRLYGFFRWANLQRPANSGPWGNAQTVVIS